jgi:hypothetical protein
MQDRSARPPRRTARGVSFEDVCTLAAALPGVERGVSYGTPSLKVKGKFLLRLKEDGETVAIKVPMDDRDLLLAADPRVFFVTDHYRGYPAILFRLAEITRGQLDDLLERGWRFVASPRMVAAFDSRRA